MQRTELDEVCIAKGIYPHAAMPGMAWLMDEVMGIDPNMVAREGFSFYGYRYFVLDVNGKKIFDKANNEILTNYHRWTEEELNTLIEWIDYIPKEFLHAFGE